MNALLNQIRMAQVAAGEQVVSQHLAQMGLCVSDAATPQQEPRPSWATGTTTTLAPGAQLCTKDGRKIGNAVITGEAVEHISGRFVWPVTTDAGTTLYLNDSEIDELFWPPQWLMDPATAPGEIKAHLQSLSKDQVALADAAVGEIMDQAQVYASSWSLVGGRFDGGNGIENANDEKSILRTMVTSLARLAAQSVKEGGAA